MKLFTIVLIFQLFFLSIVGQDLKEGSLLPAIIQDEDGWTNIRKSPNQQSEVIHKLFKDTIFWYSYEAYMTRKESWVPILIPGGDCNSSIEGFIHRSRIKPYKECYTYLLGKLTGTSKYKHHNIKLCKNPESQTNCEEQERGGGTYEKVYKKVCKYKDGTILITNAKNYEGSEITKYPSEKFTFKQVLDHYMVYHGAFRFIIDYDLSEISPIGDDGCTLEFGYQQISYGDSSMSESLRIEDGYVVYKTAASSI